MRVSIESASESDKDLIDDMMQGYIEELSHYTPIDRADNGRFVYPYLDAYWQEPQIRFPLLIIVDHKVVGFVLINRHSHLDGDAGMNVAEFYVVPDGGA